MGAWAVNEILRIAALYLTAWLLGRWVLARGVRVNYTRKILHFVLFFVPLALADWIAYPASLATIVGSGLVFVACIATFAAPLRSRSAFLATAYASIDRPEDRPYTLVWVTTQALVTYAVLVAIVVWLDRYGQRPLVYITVLIAAIGDGLAEPVGVRFGRHRYRVRALFTDRVYTRSLEGSLCVLASGVLAVLALRARMSGVELALALAVIPVATTLAEAFSPHTWDGPLIYAVGGASTVGVLELAPMLA
jgi:phytol kinase